MDNAIFLNTPEKSPSYPVYYLDIPQNNPLGLSVYEWEGKAFLIDPVTSEKRHQIKNAFIKIGRRVYIFVDSHGTIQDVQNVIRNHLRK